ncbi:MAG: hypothetical protein ACOH1O_00055 [Flavobacterium sp.]
MTTSEIKKKISEEIDILDKSTLEQVYHLLLKFLNKETTTDNWNSLSQKQQSGLLEAIDEMNSSNGLDHKTIIDKFKNKYA